MTNVARIAGLVLLLAAASVRATGDNRLTDGGFAQDGAEWRLPPSARIDERVFLTGAIMNERTDTKSLRLDSSRLWCNATVSVPVTGGVRYLCKMSLRLENALQSHAKVVWFNAAGRETGEAAYLCNGRNGGSEWFPVRTTCTAPPDAVRAEITVLAGGSEAQPGSTWVDDVYFGENKLRVSGRTEWENAVTARYGTEHNAGPMTEKVVYFDPDRRSVGVSGDGGSTYLRTNGFRQLNATELAEWMRQWSGRDADGSVCVFAMGVIPQEIVADPDDLLLARYLAAGGRAVWIGDVPFYYQSRPGSFLLEQLFVAPDLGIRGGKWNLTGETNITDAGRTWGVKSPDVPRRCDVGDKDATLLFSTDPSGAYGASYFINYNLAAPYSGWVRYRAGVDFDAANPAHLQDLYRLALYRGAPVAAPEPVIATPEDKRTEALRLELPLENYRRGMDIPITVVANIPSGREIRLELRDGAGQVCFDTGWDGPGAHAVPIPTEDLAEGEYRLTVAAGTEQAERQLAVVAAHVPKLQLGLYAISGAEDPRFARLMWKDIAEHLGENALLVLTAGSDPAQYLYHCDLAWRYRMQVAFVSHAYYQVANPGQPDEEELAVRLADGGKPKYYFTSRAPAALCLGNPKLTTRLEPELQNEMAAAQKYPAFSQLVFCNDDVGWFGEPEEHKISCYCADCRRRFKAETGLEAPVTAAPELLRTGGIFPDDDPWYLWMKFRARSYGEFTGRMEKFARGIAPGVKFCPMPAGGFGSPVLLAEWALNPADNYAQIGTAGYYYYPHLASAECFVLYNDLAIMNHRDRELWVVPQSTDYAGMIHDPQELARQVGSQFHHNLLGGVRGIVYYEYSAVPGTPSWPVLREAADFARRFGAWYLALKRAPRPVAVLASYGDISYRWCMGEGGREYEELFLTLRRTGIPAEFISDEELIGGGASRYEAIILPKVDFMSASAARELERFLTAGGTVWQDERSRVPLSGSRRLKAQDIPSAVRTELGDRVLQWSDGDLMAAEFSAGEARVFAFANCRRDQAVKGNVRLPIADSEAVYDLNGGGLLGHGPEVALSVPDAGGAMLITLPREIGGVSVTGPDAVKRGSATLHLAIRDRDGNPLKAILPLALEVIAPDGTVHAEYSDWPASGPDGTLEWQIPFAVNDTPGTWTVRLTEPISGVVGQCLIRLND